MGLRELRQKRGLTQQRLAERIPGLTQSRVADWETGQRDIGEISLNTALKLCDALRVANPRKLLDDPENDKS
ncbi:helix-turn-helix domain-containing protein [Bifidobacterium avesanii]|uniref:Helix-turn-helix domain-containing protein n=1 Tax=Bifidobacterium avesanii TaxID=1798157 RepID=A0A7K3TGM3_9BIFI|nr:helix-turn-helix transcriptional regulator [Bifidobacterium avesanii]NEG78241.1 helix-turn-helix domain-containing protein [Bifidobacterium avesanii]